MSWMRVQHAGKEYVLIDGEWLDSGMEATPTALAQELDRIVNEDPALRADRAARDRHHVEDAHARFREGRGRPPGRLEKSRSRRTSRCYSCRRSLDSAVDWICADCRWIVCKCGACGCRHVGHP